MRRQLGGTAFSMAPVRLVDAEVDRLIRRADADPFQESTHRRPLRPPALRGPHVNHGNQGTTSLARGTTESVTVEEPAVRAPDDRYGGTGLDVALLLLRLILAATIGAHGLIKVFGFLGGPGLTSFAQVLHGYGFTRGITLLSWVTGLTEVGASVMLVLGLATPLAAAGVLGVQLSVVWAKHGGGFFEGAGTGFEFELTLVVIALVLLLAGAGRLSLDARTPWGRSPLFFGLAGLLVAILASIAINLAF
jgi:putative oxidoreductase